jgi:hypothetical protein
MSLLQTCNADVEVESEKIPCHSTPCKLSWEWHSCPSCDVSEYFCRLHKGYDII